MLGDGRFSLIEITMIPERALILGTGQTGQSLLRFLDRKCELVISDTRWLSEAEANHFATELGTATPSTRFVSPSELDSFISPDWAVYLSPGLSLNDLTVQQLLAKGCRMSSDIELFLYMVDVPVVGITGTNGKSTVTALTGRILEKSGFLTGGNIGVPVLDLLNLQANGYVIELSSFQLERMPPPKLAAATVINITEDHVDHHGSFDAYVAVKHRIYENSKHVVFDGSNPITIPTTYQDAIVVNDDFRWFVGESYISINGTEVNISDISLCGRMNHVNAVIASALAFTCGAGVNEIVETLKSFRGLPHRTQWVAEIDEVNYINDSKATNVGATAAALASLAGEGRNVVLLAGGEGKGAQFEPLLQPIEQHVKHLVLFGEDAKTIGDAVAGSTNIHYSNSLDDAVKHASTVAQAGDIVVLSPACASFDMFSNFEERGLRFEEAVSALAT